MRVRYRLGVPVLLLALSACSVGPAYHRPEVALPQHWTTPTSAEAAQWPTADWWRSFHSAALDGYVAQALAASDDIAAAVAQVREADAQARIAGAALLPAVGVSGEAVRESEFTPGGVSKPFSEYAPVLSASYALDFWGKYRAQRQAAVQAAYASRYNRETVVLTVLSGVASNYFQALEMHDRVQVAENNLANAQHILQGFETEQRVGTATALDVAQQAAVVAVENATIPPLRQQEQASIDALAILLGRAPESVQLASATLDQIAAPTVLAGLPSTLLARRPDVAEAEANLHAANADIVQARAAFFPNVVLTGSGGYASSKLSSLILPGNQVFSLSGTITQDIFEGGALRGQYQYTQARYAELLADYHKSVISALSDVDQALDAVQQTADQQQREQAAVDAAQRAYDYAQQQMAAGITNILTVLNTETTLFTAQDTLVQVKFQHLLALVQLYQALGGGWQQSQVVQAKL